MDDATQQVTPHVGAVAMVREHYRVECLLDDPSTRTYRSHVSILLEALDALTRTTPEGVTQR